MRTPGPFSVETEFSVLDEEPNQFLFGAYKNVTMFVWMSQATGPAVTRLGRVTEPIYAAHPEGISNVHIVARGLSLPTPEARAAFVSLMTKRATLRACISVVVCGSGFWASTLRSFITGMRIVSPRSYELGLHTSIEEACEWLPAAHLSKTGVALKPSELSAVLYHAQTFHRDRDLNERVGRTNMRR